MKNTLLLKYGNTKQEMKKLCIGQTYITIIYTNTCNFF